MTNQLLANKLLLARLKEKGAIKDIKPDKSFGKPVKAKVPQDVVKSGFYGNSYSDFKIEITKKGELFYQLNQKKNMYIRRMEAL